LWFSFVKLADPASDYYTEAVDRFRALIEGRKLVANIDYKERALLHLRLIDPSNPIVTQDPLACINADLVSEGLAVTDQRGCKYLSAYPQVTKKLQALVTEAKRDHAGMFEFGDIEEDDDWTWRFWPQGLTLLQSSVLYIAIPTQKFMKISDPQYKM
jgi:staphylococcal nuclease domain-containing protein 1